MYKSCLLFLAERHPASKCVRVDSGRKALVSSLAPINYTQAFSGAQERHMNSDRVMVYLQGGSLPSKSCFIGILLSLLK